MESSSRAPPPGSPEVDHAIKQRWLRQTRSAWEAALQRRKSEEHQQHADDRVLLDDVLQGWISRIEAVESNRSKSEIDALNNAREAGAPGPAEAGRRGASSEQVALAPAPALAPVSEAEAQDVERQLKQQWLQERRREWATALAARHNFDKADESKLAPLDTMENQVRNGWPDAPRANHPFSAPPSLCSLSP